MSEYLHGRAIHVDQNLSNIALNYRPMGFIAMDVLPVVTVPKQTDRYVIFEQADIFRRQNTQRAPGTEARKMVTRASSGNFFCENFALKTEVTIEDRANADPIFLAELEAGRVMRLQDALALDEEIRMAATIFSTTAVGSYAAVGSAWTDYSNSDPLGDINTGLDNVHDATGYRPNVLVFGEKAWRHARRNASLIDKATNPNVSGGGNYPNRGQLAQLFDVDRILVGTAKYNTAAEGQPMSLSDVWADHVLAMYVPTAPSREAPSFGYTFRWAHQGIPNKAVIRHPYDSRIGADEVELAYYQDEKVTGSALSFLIANVTSST